MYKKYVFKLFFLTNQIHSHPSNINTYKYIIHANKIRSHKSLKL